MIAPTRGTGVRARASAYLEARQLPDGGFFFAQVEPSCGADTYHAVVALRTLGGIFDRSGVVRFFKRMLRLGPHTLAERFFAIGALSAIDVDVGSMFIARPDPMTDITATIAALRVDRSASPSLTGSILKTAQTYGAASALFRSAFLARVAHEPLDGTATRASLAALRQPDGAFGIGGRSDAQITFDAVRAYRELGEDVPEAARVVAWLNGNLFSFPYLEHVRAVGLSCALLGAPLPEVDAVGRYVEMCERANGGFARSPAGIPTIESTYHAVTLLDAYRLL